MRSLTYRSRMVDHLPNGADMPAERNLIMTQRNRLFMYHHHIYFLLFNANFNRIQTAALLIRGKKKTCDEYRNVVYRFFFFIHFTPAVRRRRASTKTQKKY